MAWHLMNRWILIAIYPLLQEMVFTSAIATMHEICIMETLHAQCLGDSVISMQTALYGRMRPGDCAPANSGNFGCVANALNYMDSQCSGRKECSIYVPDEGLAALNQCPRGQTPFLEASYICIPVLSGSVFYDACQRNGIVEISGISEGVIASSDVFSSVSINPSLCPYSIEAEPGQRINITLVDFGHSQRTVSEPSGSGLRGTCKRYALVTEGSGTSPTTVCSGAVREQGVYLSESHQLEIQFVQPTDGDSNFLLKFTLLGCADTDLKGNVITHRSLEMIIIRCERSGNTQRLHCEGNEWNAKPAPCYGNSGNIPRSWSSLEGLVITLGIGIFIGAVIACVVMCCICYCIKRRSSRKQPRQIIYYEGNAPWNAGKRINNWDINNGTIGRAGYNTSARRSDKDYEPVYDQVLRDDMMIEAKDLPNHYNTLNSNILDDLPLPIQPASVNHEHPYAKPV